MDQSLAVGRLQRARDLAGDFKGLSSFESAFFQAVFERFALEVLHYDVVDIVLVTDVVQHTDVGMIEAGDDFCLTLESRSGLGIDSRMCGQYLDGDDPVEPRIPGAIHLAHSPASGSRFDFIGTELMTIGKCHIIPRIDN